MPVKERTRLRNNISAQNGYILRKKEPVFLVNEIRNKDKLFDEFTQELKYILSSDDYKKVRNSFGDDLKEWFDS